MLLAIAPASFAQSGNEPPPPPGDSLVVCFTLKEAQEIGDTLWSRLDDRDKRRIARTLLRRVEEATEDCTRENDRLRSTIDPLVASEANARKEADQSAKESLDWQLKARGRGGRGFVLGFGGGLAGAFGIYKGGQALGVIR